MAYTTIHFPPSGTAGEIHADHSGAKTARHLEENVRDIYMVNYYPLICLRKRKKNEKREILFYNISESQWETKTNCDFLQVSKCQICPPPHYSCSSGLGACDDHCEMMCPRGPGTVTSPLQLHCTPGTNTLIVIKTVFKELVKMFNGAGKEEEKAYTTCKQLLEKYSRWLCTNYTFPWFNGD